ncbi:flagellar hook-associated protein FlgK [Desulfatibacillum aliphaticivorans]|uniref:flagellar hook-associated protein FlgK n=1 Tax=Desulfatibacillum aliphaticivorans TaxID=218208 RepID=UPI00040CA3C1|nr:flagellar hook-associated protein FlgK [Desulfatibacillum aliphaticivorans]
MPGIRSALDIAVGAMATHQYGMDVVSHNVANVNTEGYTLQTVINKSKVPQASGGFMFGRGVETYEIRQLVDETVEKRLLEYRSSLASAEEIETFGKVLDGLFNEVEGNGLGTMLSDFFNSWEDLSLNSAGTAERSVLYEQALGLAQYIDELDAALIGEEENLGISLQSGVEAVNTLTSQIADLNQQIVAASQNTNPNDLLDQRNYLMSELAQYIDVQTFAQDDGSLTVLGPRGVTLVIGSDRFDINLHQGDIIYGKGTDKELTITDYVEKGRMGGWLEMRDTVISELRANLNEVSKEMIWAVNTVHSQGIGLTGLTSTTGSYTAAATNQPVGSAAADLFFGDRITDGGFTFWVYDASGNVVNPGGTNIAITANTTTMDDIATALGAVDLNVTASTVGGRLSITAGSGYTFGFTEDTSNVLAALGVNTFFTGEGSGTMGIHETIAADRNMIAAGKADAATGEISSGNNETSLAIGELKYTNLSITEWQSKRIGSDTSITVNASIEGFYASMISALGSSLNSAERNREFAESMVQNLETVRGSISGVSLDEEMTKLIELQQSYAAAAKLITTMDEIFQTLMTIKS